MIPTTYLITPKSAGTIFAITGLNFTQLLPLKAKGDAIAFGAGKYMGFDGADSPFNGGGGHTTFLHLAFNGTPTNGRLVPSVTNGANLAWIRKGNPFLTFSREIETTLNLSSNPCIVTGDQVLLQQVLVNLLMNAMDAMADTAPARRRVTISTEVKTVDVEVSVRDTGTH